MAVVRAVSVGGIEPLETARGSVDSGIRKRPVAHRVAVGADGLEGDHQADRRYHGGPDKAVYLFPGEHYSGWAQYLGCGLMPPGFFGENLSSEGVSERSLCIGDRLEIGTARLIVRSPRLPCYKWVALTANRGAARRMLDEATTGVYLSVERDGEIGAGDPILVIERHVARTSVADYVDAMMQRLGSDQVARILQNDALPEDRKQLLISRIANRYDGTV